MRTRDTNKELAIRQKALEMVVKDGLDGFSMQNLAKAAGVSPATIYIYFKDREDLVVQLCLEAGEKMLDATLVDFDPSMPFSDGLRIQWINRARYCLKYPMQVDFLEQVRHSPLYDEAYKRMGNSFRTAMHEFVSNAIKRKELVKVPLEVYWSVAFGPLYNLVKFQQSGKSLGGKPFTLTDKIMMDTLELVLKALKP